MAHPNTREIIAARRLADCICGLAWVAILVNFASTSTTRLLRAAPSIQANDAGHRRNAANASNSYSANREAIATAMVATQLLGELGVRFATFMRFLSLLLLLYAVGTVDGLTERAIRRSGGGRESASLYHRAKYLQMAMFGLGGVVLFVWPGSIAWEN